MVNFNLILAQGASTTTINRTSSNLTWTYNKEALGVEVSLTKANPKNLTPLFPTVKPRAGDKLLLYDGINLIFEAIIQDTNTTKTTEIKALDYGHYLNKTQVLIQFKSLSADQAIKQLLNQIGFPIGTIAPIPTKITEIYKDTPSGIIEDILDKAAKDQNKEYQIEYNNRLLNIQEPQELIIAPRHQPTFNIGHIDVSTAPNNEGVLTTIAELKNNIIVVDNNNKILAEVSDQDSITKYGKLTEIIETDGNQSQALNQAQNTLDKSKAPKQTANLTLLGDTTIRTNRLIRFNLPEQELQGLYLIEQAAHTWTSGQIYKTKVELTYVRP